MVPCVAFAGLTVGEQAGTSEVEIRAFLEERGYSVNEFETEDGTIEVEFTDAGRELEIEIDATTGKIVEVELEDDDDSSDDDSD